MIKGFWQRRVEKQCESIYLFDRDRRMAYTFTITQHKVEPACEIPGTDLSDEDGLMSAMAEALQAGGYIPKSAVDAELAATKRHLEDMRMIAKTRTEDWP